MVVSFRVALAAGLFAGVTAAGALDFQLNSTVVEEDGFKHEQLFFHNDAKTDVYISLPSGWERAAAPGSLTLAPAAETDTMVRLEKSLVAPDLPFKDKGLETYRRLALAAVPQGATETRVVEEHDDPLPIFHWKSHEFVVDYVFFGRAFRRSLLFLDLNAAEQIQVTAVAPKAVYDRAHGAAFDVLRSWQMMPRGE